MKYCPTCDADRSPEQQDDHGRCAVCGTELLDDPAGVATGVPDRTLPIPERPDAERPDAGGPDAGAAEAPAQPEPAPDDAARPATGKAGPAPSSPDPLETVAIPTPGLAAGDDKEAEGRGSDPVGTPDPAASPEGAAGSGATGDGGTGDPDLATTDGTTQDGPAEDRATETRATEDRAAEDGAAGDGAATGTAPPRTADEWLQHRREQEAAGRPRRPSGGGPVDTGAVAIPQPWRPDAQQRPAAMPPPSAPTADAAPARDYERLVAEVEAKVRDGYELFGLVGGPASGKTHALKALTYLLRNTGTQSDRASFELTQSVAPGPTGVKVAHYDYLGPSHRWTFVDAGGELYAGLRRNDWDTFAAHTTRLSRWLHRAHGLLCFLHLRPGHFGGYVLDSDPTLEDDGERRAALEERRREALENQAELAFFRNFFLFLRALQAEDGDVGRVIDTCRAADSLEDALQGYARSTPLLDVPVMFFFSQADLYEHHDFAVGPGTYVNPRRLDRPANAFAARHLPTLFAGVASQVRRFKLDFLQSYEEAVTEQRGPDGEPQVKTYWSAPDDPHSYLSMGLLAGLEFLLRSQPRRRRWWEPPELTTRRALILHRLLHPGDWEGVSRGLLGSWREPAPLRPETAEDAENADNADNADNGEDAP